jgi:6-phosphogluconolactonase (cycloisomerase 2 family)
MKYGRLTLALIALAACNTDRTTSPLMSDARNATLSRESNDSDFEGGDDEQGMVYTSSNQAAGNAVLAFRRSTNGTLTPAGSFATGGTGTGSGLGSQNALAFSREGELLFVVNAGSNDVSSFRIDDGQLRLVSRVSSGGTHPISLSAARGLVYVLNDGGTGNISGLRYSNSGVLSPIAGSSRALSSSSAAPAQIEFSPDGARLVVTEKGTNTIDAYNVGANGLADAGHFTPSSGATPFGFAFRRNTVIVTEAFGGAAGKAAVSSYNTSGVGPVALLSGSVADTQTSACWFAVTGNGKYGYAANTGSNTVSGYAIANNGTIARIDNGVTANLGAGAVPADEALSNNSHFLYVRNGGNGTISALAVHSNGSLTVLSGGATGLPRGSVGLLAR